MGMKRKDTQGESTQITQLGRIINEVRKKAENARRSVQTSETSEKDTREKIKETMVECQRMCERMGARGKRCRKLRKDDVRYDLIL